jgi:LmbE family N-acetylglucosaminyl deacetylase
MVASEGILPPPMDKPLLVSNTQTPLIWSMCILPSTRTVLVLAPHPDDFDAIGVTLRWLHQQGHVLYLAVATGGAGGVEDGFEGARTPQSKAALREAEQRASLRFFGLPEARLRFLRLWEGDDADDTPLREHLRRLRPDLVFLPHGDDANRTHRRVYETLRAIVEHEGLSLWACLNQDAKTRAMRHDLVMPFDAEAAAWKAELLRHHGSQQARNLASRGHGFDERVLQLNRDAAGALELDAAYAELFELQRFEAGVLRADPLSVWPGSP